MKRKSTALLLLSALCCGSTSTSSSAITKTEAPQGPQLTQSSWYGWKILLVDIAGVSLTIASSMLLDDESDAAYWGLAVTELAVYALGPAIVHLVEGSWGKALGSGAMRLLTPVATGGLGFLIGGGGGCSGDDWCLGPAIGATIGVLSGQLLAAIIDIAALAHKEVPIEEPSVAPMVQAGPDGMTVGIVGRW